ncbi:MAG: ribonuclease R [Bacteroidales bacterium]|nr:ribonuclease R [Bacteroidales bacterium]MDD4030052.1 ribonuclease R [Bacteroidales bacterium]MDD4436075.1 ribonuclease R [Bacteroidales bacterium]MDD5732597.1 ribonuclease R [Bacteroidales bacterium]
MSKKNNRKDRSVNNHKGRQNRKPARAVEYRGKLSMTREGYAFLLVSTVEGEAPVDDIFIPARKLGGALHGDQVKVAMVPGKSRNGRKVEGEVTEVLERSSRPYVGILQIHDKQAFVITDSRNMPFDIQLVKDGLSGAKNGQKVAVLVTGWDRKNQLPVGKIVDVLGIPGENTTEMHAILAEFGLPYRFERQVEEEAQALQEEILADEIRERKDFREVPTFTIDPSDAKDYDDALSFRRTGPGNAHMEVGIHIADVSYYVDPGSLLDQAAYERGNSVYLVDRTIPMLPEKLSNRLCSLRPNEDKLCFSAVFCFDQEFKVVSRWFGRTVIRSSCRMSYEEAQAVLDKVPGVMTSSGPVPDGIRNGLFFIHALAHKLRKERFGRGAVAFERPEVKVQVDDKGVPLSIHVKEQLDSHWLIEEFMLLANREVAEFIQKKKDKGSGKVPAFVYRVHESPAEDKMTAFRNFVHHFGYEMKQTRTVREYARELNRLLEKTKEKPESSGIVIMALRSMARAHYTTSNVGHYGLAFDYYTHFTSPIRRYSDLMVHRLLLHYMNGGTSESQADLETRCTHISQREQLATEAERASIKYKMVEYMQDKVGQEFEGAITGLTEWGMYVELAQTQIEGMVALRDIQDDYYVFDKDSMSITGTHNGTRYVLGQKVRIRVSRANLEQKQLDFILIQ